MWVSQRPLGTDITDRARRTPYDHVGNAVFWPLAVLLIIHRVFVLAINGNITDDFSTVYYALRRFLDGERIYNEVYYFVDPHYLYSPGATLFLSPLGMLTDFDAARLCFIIANAASVVVALGILTRLFGFSLHSMVWPVSIAGAFATESVRNTLVFSNINGLLLLALVGFYALLLSDRRWSAGLLLGCAILIKPIFAPLLFLPFVKANWQTIASAFVIPVGFNAVAWATIPTSHEYLSRTIPYLGETRDFANSSLPGIAVYFGMPTWQEKFWFFFFAAVVIVGLVALLRYRYSDPLLWMVCTGSLLLAGVFFLSSLGQMYYSMLLFPLLFTTTLARSPMHTWVAWLAAYGFLSADEWRSDEWIDAGRWITYLKPTIGWGLILLCIAVSATMWVLSELHSKERQS
ncbi:glycosyltransferase family 87 protein [Corynebacterium epidermidicanis]|uniref:glycosyltransferase family 87 protein n=1 Tax=Corynebacterium epidermidicanis TaxID=1050174 RepID=UPI00191C5D25|nr:glycosyltransferase family 87 protein [Corynebacterium epidermidicanis]